MTDMLRVYEDTDDIGQQVYVVEYYGKKFALTEGIRMDYEYDRYVYTGVYKTPARLIDMRLSLRCREIPPKPKPEPKRTRTTAYGLRRPA